VLLNGKCIQDVSVVFDLMVAAVLVSHNDGAFSFISAAAIQIFFP
jgi:hypothetical protein